jgi:WhiB family transcriptional regulator, redox-sensing transcriptional regulator
MAPMLRPDASASATSAAGFESISSRSEAVAVIDPYIDEHAGQVATATGIAMIFGQAEVPTGLDLPCADDPELFFAEAPEDVEAAKALCQGCRAREVCLEGALERREPWGVWGGELLLRGIVVPRKRPRGRPRKAAAEELTSPAKTDEQAA